MDYGSKFRSRKGDEDKDEETDALDCIFSSSSFQLRSVKTHPALFLPEGIRD